MTIKYLTLDEVVGIHYDQIARYGGSHGIRDLGLLSSAIFRSQATFAGEDLYPALWNKAAVLLQSLILNHAFLDGNKRTAVVSTMRFLFINNYQLKLTRQQLINLALNTENKKLDADKLSQFLKSHSQKINS